MAWAEQWTYQVSGHELNDGVKYVTQIPEIDNDPDYNVVTVPIDGDRPATIRADPTNGTWTILIQMTPCNWATYQTRLAEINGWLPRGVLLTLTAQIRGMTSPLSAIIMPKNLNASPKQRAIAITCHVPVPVLA